MSGKKGGNKGGKSPEPKADKGPEYRYLPFSTWTIEGGAFRVNGGTCEAMLAKILMTLPTAGALTGWGVSTSIRQFKAASRYTMTADIVRSWLDMLIDRLRESVWCSTYNSGMRVHRLPQADAWKKADGALALFDKRIKALA